MGGAVRPTSHTAIAIGSSFGFSESNFASCFCNSANFAFSSVDSFSVIDFSSNCRSSRHWTMRAICSSSGLRWSAGLRYAAVIAGSYFSK